MHEFGSNSKRILRELHPSLQLVAFEAIKHADFSLICGYRGKVEQERAFNSGVSRARFGQSPHNFKPSFAFDFIPYPFEGWANISAFERVGQAILRASKTTNVSVTWGKTFKTIVDYPHFELRDWRKFV
jgi:peptidoglycan LD-endopeptidase CwlK